MDELKAQLEAYAQVEDQAQRAQAQARAAHAHAQAQAQQAHAHAQAQQARAQAQAAHAHAQAQTQQAHAHAQAQAQQAHVRSVVAQIQEFARAQENQAPQAHAQAHQAFCQVLATQAQAFAQAQRAHAQARIAQAQAQMPGGARARDDQMVQDPVPVKEDFGSVEQFNKMLQANFDERQAQAQREGFYHAAYQTQPWNHAEPFNRANAYPALYLAQNPETLALETIRAELQAQVGPEETARFEDEIRASVNKSGYPDHVIERELGYSMRQILDQIKMISANQDPEGFQKMIETMRSFSQAQLGKRQWFEKERQHAEMMRADRASMGLSSRYEDQFWKRLNKLIKEDGEVEEPMKKKEKKQTVLEGQVQNLTQDEVQMDAQAPEQAQLEASTTSEETQDHEEMKRKIEALEKANQALTVQNECLENATSTLYAKNKFLAAQLDDAKTRIKSHVQIELEAVKDKAQMEFQVIHLSDKIQEAQKNLEAEKRANEDYKAQIESLKDALKTQAQVIPQYLDLKAQKQNLEKTPNYEAQTESLKAQIEAQKEPDYEAQVASLTAEKEELKEELKDLRETWRVSGVLMNTLLQEAIEMKKSQVSLKEELAELKSFETDYQQQIDKLAQKVQQWEIEDRDTSGRFE